MCIRHSVGFLLYLLHRNLKEIHFHRQCELHSRPLFLRISSGSEKDVGHICWKKLNIFLFSFHALFLLLILPRFLSCPLKTEYPSSFSMVKLPSKAMPLPNTNTCVQKPWNTSVTSYAKDQFRSVMYSKLVIILCYVECHVVLALKGAIWKLKHFCENPNISTAVRNSQGHPLPNQVHSVMHKGGCRVDRDSVVQALTFSIPIISLLWRDEKCI